MMATTHWRQVSVEQQIVKLDRRMTSMKIDTPLDGRSRNCKDCIKISELNISFNLCTIRAATSEALLTQDPFRTWSENDLILSSTSQTSGTTFFPSHMISTSLGARRATCSTGRSSVLFICPPGQGCEKLERRLVKWSLPLPVYSSNILSMDLGIIVRYLVSVLQCAKWACIHGSAVLTHSSTSEFEESEISEMQEAGADLSEGLYMNSIEHRVNLLLNLCFLGTTDQIQLWLSSRNSMLFCNNSMCFHNHCSIWWGMCFSVLTLARAKSFWKVQHVARCLE